MFDKPTHEDKLGYEPYVKSIENFIRHTKPEELPIAIGIYGAWGSGKTSFMYQLWDRFDIKIVGEEQQLPIVWFEAWKYDRSQDVRSALIFKILLELREKANGDARRKITSVIKKAGQIGAGLFMHSKVTVGVQGVGIASLTPEELKNLTKDAERFQTIIDKFEDDFSEAVEAYLCQLSSCSSSRYLTVASPTCLSALAV